MLVPIYCISGIPLYFPDMFDRRSPAKPPHFCLCRERGPHVPTRDAPEQGGCAYPTPSGACPYPSNLIAIVPPDSSRCLQARPAAEPSQTSTSCAGVGSSKDSIHHPLHVYYVCAEPPEAKLAIAVSGDRTSLCTETYIELFGTYMQHMRAALKTNDREPSKNEEATSKHNNEHPDQDSHFGQPPSRWISLLRRGGWSLPTPQ